MADVFFIIDGDKLQAQAHFLAASIIDHKSAVDRYFAYIRPGVDLPASLRGLLDKANIELRDIPRLSPDPWSAPYPIGNKLLAAADNRGGEVSVFLDTDTIFCGAVDFEAELGEAKVGAVLSDYRAGGLSNSAAWVDIYEFLGIDMPSERPGTLRRPHMDYPPYFNAGMVILRERSANKDLCLGKEWLKVSLALDNEFDVAARGISRANIDQIALSALGSRVGAPTKSMPQKLNYNVMAWGGPPVGTDCAIAHYHVFGRLWKAGRVGQVALSSLRKHLGQVAFAGFVNEYRTHLYWRRAKRLVSDQPDIMQ